MVGLRETGCRPSELRRARVERLKIEEGVLYVGNKVGDVTGEEERVIHLSPVMLELVKKLVEGRATGFLFRTTKGCAWGEVNMEKHWSRTRAKAGIKGTLYQYRHGFISKAINSTNVNPAIVAQLVGHTDLQMLLKYYLHEDPTALKKAVEEITRQEQKEKPKE